MGIEWARTVLQGLYFPSLDAADKCRGVPEVAGVRRRSDAGDDDRDSEDKTGDGDPAHAHQATRTISRPKVV
jgi:hypothetical protein